MHTNTLIVYCIPTVSLYLCICQFVFVTLSLSFCLCPSKLDSHSFSEEFSFEGQRQTCCFPRHIICSKMWRAPLYKQVFLEIACHQIKYGKGIEKGVHRFRLLFSSLPFSTFSHSPNFFVFLYFPD